MNTDEHRWINTDFEKDLGKIQAIVFCSSL